MDSSGNDRMFPGILYSLTILRGVLLPAVFPFNFGSPANSVDRVDQIGGCPLDLGSRVQYSAVGICEDPSHISIGTLPGLHQAINL